MKRSVSLLALLGLIMSLALISCNMGFGSSDNSKSESTIKGPANKGDTNSIVLNEVWEDENGDKWVNLTMNALNDIVQDSRTIIPDNPDLYFSVVASTDAWEANSVTSVSTYSLDASFHAKLDGDAKCSMDVAGQTGKLVIDPYYALETNKMTGLTLTLKVGKAYYFTVYATNEKPTEISTSNFASQDIIKDTIYTQKIAHAGQTLNTAANYYANRADLIAHLANLAVVKGTAQFFISDNNGDVAIYEGAAASGTPVSKIKIDASADDISGFGYALIPIDLEETKTLNDMHLRVEKIRFKWTPRKGTESGTFDVDVNGAAQDIALFPKISVGEYDTDLILLDSSNNDIFTIHDTLTVWKNQVSVLLGNSTYYKQNVASWTKAWVGNSIPVSGVEAPEVSSVKNTPTLITQGMANDITGPVIGYKITANQIKNYFRTIFYVSGSGADLPAEATLADQNGSLFHPYSTVQAALDAITLATSTYSRANGYGEDATDWNIVIDGAPTTAGDVSFNNTLDKQFNLTFRMFNDTRVTLADNITLTNESSTKDFNVWLTNVDWDGAGKTFTAAANVLLTNSSLASDITTPAAGDGNVVLYKKSDTNDTKQDGIFYALTTDNSTVMNISNIDDAGKAVLKDAAVLRYDYFTPNTTYTTSPAVTYMTTDVLDKNTVTALEIFNRDPDSSGTAPVPKPRFAVSDAYRTGDASVTDVSNPEIERVLDIDEEVGSDNYGCVIVKTKVNNIAVGFKQGVLRVYVKEWSPNTSDYASFTAAEVAAGTAAITVTLEVTSEDSANYPSNSPDIVAVLGALGDGTGDGKLSTSMEGDQGTKAKENTHYTVTYPSAVGTYTAPVAPSKKDSCTYTMTVTLDESLAGAVGYNETGAKNAPDEAEFRFYIGTSLGGSDFKNPIGIKITKD